MTFVIPDIFCASYNWLNTVDPATVSEPQFRMALVDFVQHSIAQGISADQFMHDDVYFHPGDLQHYENIRSVWSVPAGAQGVRPIPPLTTMQAGIRGRVSFRDYLDSQYQLFRKWCVEHRYDPDNPDETSLERNRRMSRERMRRMRDKNAESDITDPTEMDIVRKVRAAKENLKAGRAYVREQEGAAKDAYDSAVAAAKLARLQTVSTAQAWLPIAEKAVKDAEAELLAYRIA